MNRENKLLVVTYLPIISDVSNGTEKLLKCVHSSMIPLMNCSASLSLQCILPISIFFPLFDVDLKKGRLTHKSEVNSDIFQGFSGFFSAFCVSSTLFKGSLRVCGLLSTTRSVSLALDFCRIFSWTCFLEFCNNCCRSAGGITKILLRLMFKWIFFSWNVYADFTSNAR